MNVISRLEFELVYDDSTVHRFNHYTTRTPSWIREMYGNRETFREIPAVIDVRGSLNKFPDFFRMGTFIDCTHMKINKYIYIYIYISLRKKNKDRLIHDYKFISIPYFQFLVWTKLTGLWSPVLIFFFMILVHTRNWKYRIEINL